MLWIVLGTKLKLWVQVIVCRATHRKGEDVRKHAEINLRREKLGLMRASPEKEKAEHGHELRLRFRLHAYPLERTAVASAQSFSESVMQIREHNLVVTQSGPVASLLERGPRNSWRVDSMLNGNNSCVGVVQY